METLLVYFEVIVGKAKIPADLVADTIDVIPCSFYIMSILWHFWP